MTTQINILIVDDVEYSRVLLRAALLACIDDLKANITANFFNSSTGRDLLEIVKEKAIDLVYLDIELPQESGLKLLEEVREVHPELAVMMVSSESSADNVKESIKKGANGFIVKPFNSKRILDSIQNYLKKAGKL